MNHGCSYYRYYVPIFMNYDYFMLLPISIYRNMYAQTRIIDLFLPFQIALFFDTLNVFAHESEFQ